MFSGADAEILEEGNTDRVQALLQAKPNLHLEDDNTPLHIAAFFGHFDLLKILIAEHVEWIDRLNRYGWSPLMQACHEGYHDCVKFLLDSGADPNVTNPLGITALTVATRGGFEKVIELLFNEDVYITRDEIFDAISNPLHLAVLHARDDIVKLFIRQGMNVNCRNKFTQWTPLMTASVSGEICTARLLFKHDADGQLSNTAGMSASQIARKCRNNELAGFIDRKTHLNLSNSLENKDNIISAVKRGDEEAVKKLLIDNPTVANSHNKDAATPLMYASMLGHLVLVEILLEQGADINAKDYDNGWTALMQATYYGQAQIAKYLIKRGANVSLRAKNGVTAFDMAMLINLNDTELFRMLADRAIEATDINETINTDYTSTFGSSTQIDSNTPPRKFLSKISKSFKNLSWFKTETDLNGTMVASKLGTEMISDKPSQQIFSPLHTCPLGQSSNAEDLPELTPPEINITKPIATKSTVRPSGTFNKKTAVNSKLLFDGSSTSKSSSGSGGRSSGTLREMHAFSRKSAKKYIAERNSLRSKSSSNFSSTSHSSKTSSTLTPTMQDLDLDEDVKSVLEELSMTRKYQKIFAEQEIDLEVFQNLSITDLKELGITQPNIRIKLLEAIAQVKNMNV